MKTKWIVFLCAIAFFCMSLCGCSLIEFDGKAQLVSPLASGDEGQVQKVLENYILSTSEKNLSNQYKLRYPRTGDYQTAFITEDVDSDGSNEVIVFYTMINAPEMIHVNYLKKSGAEWESINDITVPYSAIREVIFADLDGDNVKELLIGWEVGTTRDDHLCLYRISSSSMDEIGSFAYSKLLVENFSSSIKKDLFLFHMSNTESDVTVKMITVLDGTPLELGNVHVDGYIKQMDNFNICELSKDVKGVFFDGYKEGSDVVTELICWDGKNLTAPFYDEDSNITSLTARTSGIESLDVDGDGIPEWPRSEKMIGNKEMKKGDKTSWLTEWCSWDYENQSISSKFYSITVPEDRYYFRIEEEWLTELTSFYWPTYHRLYLFTENDDGDFEKELVLYPRDFIEKMDNKIKPPADSDQFKEIFIRKNDTSIMAKFGQQGILGIDENQVLYRLVFY